MMPPMYLYKDERTGMELEVLRSLKESDLLPTEEEASEAGMSPRNYKHAFWKRVIQGGISVVRGASWGGGKGNW